MVAEVRRRLHHAPGVARGADTPAFAGIGHKVVVPAVITPRPGKAMGEDAAFQIFAKGLADIGARHDVFGGVESGVLLEEPAGYRSHEKWL